MTERIGIRLTELIGPLVPFYLAEAETDGYPFAVYDHAPAPVYTKDGIFRYSSEVDIVVISDKFDEALGIANDIDEALQGIGEDFSYRLNNTASECTDGVWAINMNIQVNQYR